jgi:hypothetical protein
LESKYQSVNGSVSSVNGSIYQVNGKLLHKKSGKIVPL